MKPLSAALRPLLGAALAMVVAAFGPTGRSCAVMAEPPPGATMLLAQADTSGAPNLDREDVEDEEEEDVPIPPNLRDKEMLPDTSEAVPDTLREALPTSPARADTLHMPTGQPPRDVSGTQPRGIPSSAPGTSRGSLFGLAPIIVIGAIVVITVFLVRAVGGS